MKLNGSAGEDMHAFAAELKTWSALPDNCVGAKQARVRHIGQEFLMTVERMNTLWSHYHVLVEALRKYSDSEVSDLVRSYLPRSATVEEADVDMVPSLD